MRKHRIICTVDIDDFKDGVKNYFRRLINSNLLATSDSVEVSIHKIESITIVEGGADDFRACTLNGERKNVPLSLDELPTLGEVTFT